MSTVIEDIQTAETIEEAVFVALGAASACWETLEGAGEFRPERAKEIGHALLERIGVAA